MAARVVTVYIDYKSPYAYLAKDPAWELEREFDVRLEWLPYTLEIPEFLGTVEGRNAHQWRRIRYSYMDARRLANRRGLTVRGPQKIFDSSIAAIGMLYAAAPRRLSQVQRSGLRALLEARAGHRKPRSDSSGALGGRRAGRGLL